jgi:hypothetical protein
MNYVCPYLNDLDDSIRHAERVIDASFWDKEKQNWWKKYRNQLLKTLLKHQLIEFKK